MTRDLCILSSWVFAAFPHIKDSSQYMARYMHYSTIFCSTMEDIALFFLTKQVLWLLIDRYCQCVCEIAVMGRSI